MSDDVEFEEENAWFEPVEEASISDQLGWYASLSYPQRRILIFAVMIAATMTAAIAGGVFEQDEVRALPRVERPGNTRGHADITAEQALLKHLSRRNKTSLDKATRDDDKGVAENSAKPRVENNAAKDAGPVATLSKITAIEAVPPSETVRMAPANVEEKNVRIDRSKVMELGDAAMKRGDWEEARTQFERASKVWDQEDNPKAWRSMRYKLAKAYYKTQKPQISVAILEGLRNQHPDWDKPLFLMGLSARAADIREKAAKYLIEYISKGGKKLKRACAYIREAGGLSGAPPGVKQACITVK